MSRPNVIFPGATTTGGGGGGAGGGDDQKLNYGDGTELSDTTNKISQGSTADEIVMRIDSGQAAGSGGVDGMIGGMVWGSGQRHHRPDLSSVHLGEQAESNECLRGSAASYQRPHQPRRHRRQHLDANPAAQGQQRRRSQYVHQARQCQPCDDKQREQIEQHWRDVPGSNRRQGHRRLCLSPSLHLWREHDDPHRRKRYSGHKRQCLRCYAL